MPNIESLVVATRNPAKVEYYKKVFSHLVVSVLGLNDLGIAGKPDEIGDTAENNAEIKAMFYSRQTNLPVFSEDECLYADFLPRANQPGTHVRRVNGRDEVSDAELLAYWENIIKDVPPENRTGYWHFAYCLVNQGKLKIVTQNFPVKFYYPISSVRIPGWPLSSLQGSMGKPHSDCSPTEKQQAIDRDSKLIKDVLLKLFA